MHTIYVIDNKCSHTESYLLNSEAKLKIFHTIITMEIFLD